MSSSKDKLEIKHIDAAHSPESVASGPHPASSEPSQRGRNLVSVCDSLLPIFMSRR